MLIIPIHNINLLDLTTIFQKNIETELLNDLDSFGLLKNDTLNLKNTETRRLVYHHVIKGLCDYVLAVKGKEKIIVLHCELTSPCDNLHHYINEDELRSFFNKFITRVSKMLPIRFLLTDASFDIIRKNIKHKTGDSIETINKAKSIIDGFDISKYTFSKARYFAKKYELEYLSNNFFQQIKAKQLIIG